MKLQPNVGLNLRGARKASGLTLAEASSRIGVSVATLKRWEAGQGLPGCSELEHVFNQIGSRETCAFRAAAVGESRQIEDIERLPARPLMQFLRFKRRRLGISLHELSAATQLCPATISRYERGLRCLSPQALLSLGQALRLTPDEQQLIQTNGADLPCPNLHVLSVNAHVSIFSHLERLVKSPFDPDYWRTGLALVQATMMTGDHGMALEIRSTLRANPLAPKPSDEQRQFLNVWCNLARATIGHDPDVVFSSVERSVHESESMCMEPRTTLLGISGQAMLKIGEIGRGLELLEAADGSKNFDIRNGRAMYMNYGRFALTGKDKYVEACLELRHASALPIQQYTIDAMIIDMMRSLGDRQGVTERLAGCRAMEDHFGIGSPKINEARRWLNNERIRP